MRHLRRTLQLKTLHLRLQHPVRIGDPLVLAQMLKPTIDQKRLDEACWVGGILEHAPSIGAVAPALAAEAVERCKECPAPGRIDPILDRHQYRAAIVLDLMAHDRCGPVQRGREIDIAAGLQMPTPRDRDREERASGGDEVGERKAHTVATCPHSALPAVCAPK